MDFSGSGVSHSGRLTCCAAQGLFGTLFRVPGVKKAEHSRQIVPEPFRSLIGQRTNGCWLGYGSVLFLEFGTRTSPDDLRNHPSGEWILWCDQILWRIEPGDRVLAGSEDDRDTMEAAVRQMNGRALVSGEMDPDSGDSVLTFSENLVLRTFVLTSEEDARWNLRHENSESVMIGPPLKGVQPLDER